MRFGGLAFGLGVLLGACGGGSGATDCKPGTIACECFMNTCDVGLSCQDGVCVGMETTDPGTDATSATSSATGSDSATSSATGGSASTGSSGATAGGTGATATGATATGASSSSTGAGTTGATAGSTGTAGSSGATTSGTAGSGSSATSGSGTGASTSGASGGSGSGSGSTGATTGIATTGATTGAAAQCGDSIVVAGELCFLPTSDILVDRAGGAWVGDITEDGKNDLVIGVINNLAGFMRVYPGTETNTLGNPLSSPTLGWQWIAVADVNKDGDLDVVGTNSSIYELLYGNGDGTFADGLEYAVVAATSPGVALGLFNGDTWLDVAVADGAGAHVRLNDGAGAFGPMVSYTFSSGVQNFIGVADVNEDGNLDIYGRDVMAAMVLPGLGTGLFDEQNVLKVDLSGTPYQPIFVDLNDDQEIDVAAAVHTPASVTVRHGTGNGGFLVQNFNFAVNAVPPFALVVDDFDMDGILDLASLGDGTQEGVDVFVGDGTGLFFDAVFHETYANGRQITSGDLNGDTVPDIIASSWSGNNGRISILFSNP